MWQDISRVVAGVGRLLAEVFQRGGDFIWGMVTSVIGWFAGLWPLVQAGFTRFVAWVDSWSGGAMTTAIGTIKHLWEGLKGFFSGLWDEVEGRFQRFVERVQEFFAPIQRIIDAVRERTDAQAQAVPGPAQGQVNARFSDRASRIPGWDEPEAAVAGPARAAGAGGTQQLQGDVRIGLEPGLVLRGAETNQPGVNITGGSRGQVLGRN